MHLSGTYFPTLLTGCLDSKPFAANLPSYIGSMKALVSLDMAVIPMGDEEQEEHSYCRFDEYPLVQAIGKSLLSLELCRLPSTSVILPIMYEVRPLTFWGCVIGGTQWMYVSEGVHVPNPDDARTRANARGQLALDPSVISSLVALAENVGVNLPMMIHPCGDIC